MRATPWQVENFLGKLTAMDDRDIKMAQQEKTLKFMRSLDWRKPELVEMFQGLTVAHYSYGPTPSDWDDGKVWIFGPIIEDARAYLKLSYTPNRIGRLMYCMSLHRPEHAMTFPYANRK